MELLDGAELIKELLIDQPRHLQELVVRDELVHDLSLHPSGLRGEKGRECEGCRVFEEKRCQNGALPNGEMHLAKYLDSNIQASSFRLQTTLINGLKWQDSTFCDC